MIENSILSFYTNLYVSPTNLVVYVTSMHSFFASYILSLVFNEHNFLIKCLNLDEVKHVVFSLNGHSVSSSDGFGRCFYHSF